MQTQIIRRAPLTWLFGDLELREELALWPGCRCCGHGLQITHKHKNTLQPGLDPPARARLSMPMQVQTVPGRGGFHRWLLKNVTFPVSTALVVCADTQKARLLLKHTLATWSPTHLSESVLSSNSFQALSSCQGPHDNVKTSRCGDIYYMLKIVQYSHL